MVPTMVIILLLALLTVLALLVLFLLQAVLDRIKPVLGRGCLRRRLRGRWHGHMVGVARVPLRPKSLMIVERERMDMVTIPIVTMSMSSMRLRRRGPTLVLLLRRVLLLVVTR